ncbi:hypothetical protein [Microbulbifer sp. HZ11]|uniref:hypothetical protein n=1 Tax=Microbulbifer sp. HZ11 TaxID=1453501 RepID=UPI000A4FBF6B|nr:hypothetical protein [Microbulbifer sp. HZ11]
MFAAHVKQLYRVKHLNVGLEWVAMCPDQNARQVLTELVGEEVGAVIAGAIQAAEAKMRAANHAEPEGTSGQGPQPLRG